MGRSGKPASGGAAPDWLGPRDEGEAANRAQAREMQKEEKRKRPRRDDDEDLDKPSKGIKMAPIVLLLLLVLPAALPTILDVVAKLQYMGIIKLPTFSSSDSKYRPCLQEYYADWAPEKLGALDDTLLKFEGREKQLFAKLQKKYGKQVQIAKCK